MEKQVSAYGAKPAFLWGLLLFVLTSLGCGLAVNLPMLVISRLLQGAAAALLVPTPLALINSSYESKQEWAKAIAIWAGVGGAAGAAGPVLGWRTVFLVNIPIGLSAILLVARYVAVSQNNQQGHFDWSGQVLGILSIAALAFALIEAGRLGWFSMWILIAFGIALLSVAIFGTIISTALHFSSGMRCTLIISGFAYVCGCIVTFFKVGNK